MFAVLVSQFGILILSAFASLVAATSVISGKLEVTPTFWINGNQYNISKPERKVVMYLEK